MHKFPNKVWAFKNSGFFYALEFEKCFVINLNSYTSFSVHGFSYRAKRKCILNMFQLNQSTMAHHHSPRYLEAAIAFCQLLKYILWCGILTFTMLLKNF